jgi:hypothetical protein
MESRATQRILASQISCGADHPFGLVAVIVSRFSVRTGTLSWLLIAGEQR